MTNKMVATALKYKHKYGFSIIPADGKVPRVKWRDYQEDMATDELIATWFRQWPDANIAVVTGKVSGNVCVVDVDYYKDGNILDEIMKYIPERLKFPISTTPRGGQHWWFRSAVELSDKIDFAKGCDFRSSGIIILPPSKGYKWQTALKSTEIPELPESIIELLGSTSFKFGENEEKGDKRGQGSYFADGRRDNDLFSVSNALIKSGLQEEFIIEVLRLIILTWGEQDTEWIKAKVASAMKRHGLEGLTDRIKEWVEETSGIFRGQDVDKDLCLGTSGDKRYRSKVIRRLVEDGVVQKVGNQNGCFRKVEAVLDEIKWKDAKINDHYDLKMPLNLHFDCTLFPGNIVVIAGTPDAGKTSFVLNIAKMNMDKPINYLNSEMGPEELKTRLLLFSDMDISEWEIVDFYNRNNNFSDVIVPDSLNIIDFLEITDNFFMIAEEIRKIHDKLDKGIAVICLQKKKDVELGRGAEFGLEKPRLYISMDFQKLKIIKCKNPGRSGVNVNGKEIGFRLLHGTTFIKDE